MLTLVGTSCARPYCQVHALLTRLRYRSATLRTCSTACAASIHASRRMLHSTSINDVPQRAPNRTRQSATRTAAKNSEHKCERYNTSSRSHPVSPQPQPSVAKTSPRYHRKRHSRSAIAAPSCSSSSPSGATSELAASSSHTCPTRSKLSPNVAPCEHTSSSHLANTSSTAVLGTLGTHARSLLVSTLGYSPHKVTQFVNAIQGKQSTTFATANQQDKYSTRSALSGRHEPLSFTPDRLRAANHLRARSSATSRLSHAPATLTLSSKTHSLVNALLQKHLLPTRRQKHSEGTARIVCSPDVLCDSRVATDDDDGGRVLNQPMLRWCDVGQSLVRAHHTYLSQKKNTDDECAKNGPNARTASTDTSPCQGNSAQASDPDAMCDADSGPPYTADNHEANASVARTRLPMTPETLRQTLTRAVHCVKPHPDPGWLTSQASTPSSSANRTFADNTDDNNTADLRCTTAADMPAADCPTTHVAVGVMRTRDVYIMALVLHCVAHEMFVLERTVRSFGVRAEAAECEAGRRLAERAMCTTQHCADIVTKILPHVAHLEGATLDSEHACSELSLPLHILPRENRDDEHGQHCGWWLSHASVSLAHCTLHSAHLAAALSHVNVQGASRIQDANRRFARASRTLCDRVCMHLTREAARAKRRTRVSEAARQSLTSLRASQLSATTRHIHALIHLARSLSQVRDTGVPSTRSDSCRHGAHKDDVTGYDDMNRTRTDMQQSLCVAHLAWLSGILHDAVHTCPRNNIDTTTSAKNKDAKDTRDTMQLSDAEYVYKPVEATGLKYVAEAFEQLWQCTPKTLTDSESGLHGTRSAAEAVNTYHRTVHSALNIRLHCLWTSLEKRQDRLLKQQQEQKRQIQRQGKNASRGSRFNAQPKREDEKGTAIAASSDSISSSISITEDKQGEDDERHHYMHRHSTMIRRLLTALHTCAEAMRIYAQQSFATKSVHGQHTCKGGTTSCISGVPQNPAHAGDGVLSSVAQTIRCCARSDRDCAVVARAFALFIRTALDVEMTVSLAAADTVHSMEWKVPVRLDAARSPHDAPHMFNKHSDCVNDSPTGSSLHSQSWPSDGSSHTADVGAMGVGVLRSSSSRAFSGAKQAMKYKHDDMQLGSHCARVRTSLACLVESVFTALVQRELEMEAGDDEQAQRDRPQATQSPAVACARTMDSQCTSLDGTSSSVHTKTHAIHCEHSARAQSNNSNTNAVSAIFLSLIGATFYPLMRRHWIITCGATRSEPNSVRRTCYTNSNMDNRPTNSHGEEKEDELFASCLRVFVLIKELAPPSLLLPSPPTAQDEKDRAETTLTPSSQTHTSLHSQGYNFAVCCGTTLLQAMEVSFFLTFFCQRWVGKQTVYASRVAGCVHHRLGVSAADVKDYVKEMLFVLEHNTAKQLRHLRSRDTLFHFSGTRRKGCGNSTSGVSAAWSSSLTSESLLHRHAQSVLGVVHAHVVHPSLVWMPLWQVEEMVFVLTHHMDLIYAQPHSFSSTESCSCHDTNMPSNLANILTDGAKRSSAYVTYPPSSLFPVERPESPPATISPEMPTLLSSSASSSLYALSTPPPPAVVRVGGVSVDFHRLHGYLVLRLYVLSNVLRELRRLLLDGLTRPSSSGRSSINTEDEDDDVEQNEESNGYLSASWACDNFVHASRAKDAAGLVPMLQALAAREPMWEQARRRMSGRRLWARQTATVLLQRFPGLAAAMEGCWREKSIRFDSDRDRMSDRKSMNSCRSIESSIDKSDNMSKDSNSTHTDDTNRINENINDSMDSDICSINSSNNKNTKESNIGSSTLRGVVRSLQRLECTVQMTLRHRLFFNVAKDAQQRMAWLRMSAGHDVACDEDEDTLCDQNDRAADRASQNEQEQQRRNRKNMYSAGMESFGQHEDEAQHDGNTTDQRATQQYGDTLLLHMRRASPYAPLGFAIDGSSARITRVTTSDGAAISDTDAATHHSANDLDEGNAAGGACVTFAQAAQRAGVARADDLVGWRVSAVDGVAAHSGRAVIDLTRAKCHMTIALSR